MLKILILENGFIVGVFRSEWCRYEMADRFEKLHVKLIHSSPIPKIAAVLMKTRITSTFRIVVYKKRGKVQFILIHRADAFSLTGPVLRCILRLQCILTRLRDTLRLTENSFFTSSRL